MAVYLCCKGNDALRHLNVKYTISLNGHDDAFGEKIYKTLGRRQPLQEKKYIMRWVGVDRHRHRHRSGPMDSSAHARYPPLWGYPIHRELSKLTQKDIQDFTQMTFRVEIMFCTVLDLNNRYVPFDEFYHRNLNELECGSRL